jgi:heme exporter protein B
MKNYFLYIWYISAKDIQVELKKKELLTLTTIFAITCVVIFNIAIDVSAQAYIRVLPGILWVTIFFTAVLGLNRFLSVERDSGNFESLLLLPISRDILFLGKVTTLFFFMTIVEILIFPLFSVVFNLNIINISIILISILATFGISVLGIIIGSMTSNTDVRETLLPILLFPLIFPILLAAIEVTGAVLRGEEWAVYGKWVQLLAIIDTIFSIVCSFLFTHVMKDY